MNHAHHWVLEEPNGPTSPGRCKHCGETRMHEKVFPQDRANTAASGKKRWGEIVLNTRERSV